MQPVHIASLVFLLVLGGVLLCMYIRTPLTSHYHGPVTQQVVQLGVSGELQRHATSRLDP
jgi:hypothetical protein